MQEYEGQINKSKANIKNWLDKMTVSSLITPLSPVVIWLIMTEHFPD